MWTISFARLKTKSALKWDTGSSRKKREDAGYMYICASVGVPSWVTGSPSVLLRTARLYRHYLKAFGSEFRVRDECNMECVLI